MNTNRYRKITHQVVIQSSVLLKQALMDPKVNRRKVKAEERGEQLLKLPLSTMPEISDTRQLL